MGPFAWRSRFPKTLRGKEAVKHSSSGNQKRFSAIPEPTERQRIGNQIDAASIFARADFVNVRCMLVLGGIPSFAAMSSDLITQFNHAALVGLHPREMEGDVSVEVLEEWDPITNQDRHDRIINFVGEPETKTFAGNDTASNKPDATEPWPQAPIHQLRKIA